jgi:uncharacterized protein YcfL
MNLRKSLFDFVVPCKLKKGLIKMNRVLVFALSAALVALTGCIAQSPNANASAPSADTRITVAPNLEGDVCITDVRCAKAESSFLAFQANMVNNCNGPLAVEWKVQWLDQDGIEIDSVVSSWNARVLQPYEIGALKAVAPRPEAVDMRFYVRKRK